MDRMLVKWLVALTAACALSACGHAKSEAEVSKDVHAAQQKAAEDTAKAEQSAADKEASVRKDVKDDQRDLAHVAAVQNQKVTDTEAEGAHKVALAQCEALNGTAQENCKHQADAQYEVAKAKAKLVKAQTDPKS